VIKTIDRMKGDGKTLGGANGKRVRVGLICGADICHTRPVCVSIMNWSNPADEICPSALLTHLPLGPLMQSLHSTAFSKSPNLIAWARAPVMAMMLMPMLGLVSCGGGRLELAPVPSSNILVPTPLPTSLRFTQLAVGLWHACGVTAGGAVYCWGDNSYQQLGTQSALPGCSQGPCSSTPLAVATGVMFQTLAASLRDTCALTASGQAWCWGYGLGGQLGNGQNANSSNSPVQVLGAVPFVAIDLGGSGLLSCALGSTGQSYCWGPDGKGGLGNGTTNGSDAPAAVSGGLRLTTLTVGDDHACGLSNAGSGYCWGDNLFGDLGAGVTGPSSVPVPVAGTLTFGAISAGLEHTCGLLADGSAYCWGFYLDVGSAVVSGTGVVSAPLPVSGGQHFTTISAGEDHTCALDASGAAWCWGENLGGELGDGTTVNRAEPVPVQTSARFVAIWAGGSTCALDADGQAYCWGPNFAGQDGQAP
jgi:alpha-tubulin suppressor-like RCC1 family protein